jgi:phenylacetate-CoA ligase
MLNASRIDNFPGALLEGSAAGLIVVTTAAGGIPAIYEHEKTALLVEPGDWEALGRAVIQVLRSNALAGDLSMAGAAMARSCAWPRVRRAVYRAYGFPAPQEWESPEHDNASCATTKCGSTSR